ncbi:MAG: cytochrome b N-terminal domain-containing protein [Bacteroidales bacterium]|nr:cytochrome b N-terminal domain-containing protein [Bacteroidales bacterium]
MDVETSGKEQNTLDQQVPSVRKRRVGRITQNFFLHIHDTRVHLHSLKPTYTFGLGMILGFLFLIMIFTGVILMIYYTPSVETAYQSVKNIVFIVPGGRIVRNMHWWASQGMVIVVFLHLLRVFYTGSYLGNRSLNWVIGVVMLIVTLLSNFSGYLLPWDQLAYWAVTIGSNIAASARELTDLLGITSVIDPGGFLKKLLIGGETVGQPALSRFFALHVIFLPLTMLVLMSVHFWRIRKDGGLSRPAQYAGDKGGTNKWYAWPVLMWTELGILILVVVVVLFIALLTDAPLLEQANPSFPENPAKSPWYFLGIQELVSYSAFSGGLLIPVLYLVFLFSIPYKDREDRYVGEWFSGRKGLKLVLYSAGFALLLVISQLFVMVRYGWFRDWFPGISQWFVILLNPATITAVIFILLAEFTRRRMNSTRMGSLVLFTCAFVALVVFTVVGIWFRGPNWEFFWSTNHWPVL